MGGATLALPSMTIGGQASDGQTYVRCTLTFDPADSRIITQPVGRLILLSAEASVSLSWPQSGAGAYQGGEVRLLWLHGWLGVSNSTWSAAIPPAVVTSRSTPHRVGLAVPFSDNDIEAVETARAGGELNFQLILAGMAQVLAPPYSMAPNPGRLTELVSISHGGGPGLEGSSWFLRIPREHWLAMLHHAGRQRYLVELPAPALPERQKAWQETMRHLQGATDAYRSGRHEDVLKSCRQVVDGITSVLAQQWNVPKGGKSYPQWFKELRGRLAAAWPKDDEGRATMIGVLFEGTWEWSSPSHHYGAGVPVRKEAAFALHLATALLTFAAHLLEAHPQPVRTP